MKLRRRYGRVVEDGRLKFYSAQGVGSNPTGAIFYSCNAKSLKSYSWWGLNPRASAHKTEVITN